MSLPRKKIIAVSGSHRVGKTTLCREAAKTSPDRFCFRPMNVSDVFKKCGMTPQTIKDPEQRLAIQNAILNRIESTMMLLELSLQGSDKYALIDRCPLDVIAYTMIELNRLNGGFLWGEIEAQRKRAFQLTHRYCAGVVLLKPGIPLVNDPTKITANVDPLEIATYTEIINGLAFTMQQPTNDEAQPLMVDFMKTTAINMVHRDAITIEQRLNVLDVVVESIDAIHNFHSENNGSPRGGDRSASHAYH